MVKSLAKNGASLSMLAVALFVGASLISPDVMAAKDAAQIASNIEGNIAAFKSLAVSISYLIGICLVILGLFYLYKDSKESGRGHAKNGLIAILIGSAMLIVTVLVEYSAGSIVTEDNNATTNVNQGWNSGN